jgi:D-alanyl-D-alanine carboxypeptidase/D-alanyl-D-alanine-endopeptidase (penicillin-binding protein 4)
VKLRTALRLVALTTASLLVVLGAPTAIAGSATVELGAGAATIAFGETTAIVGDVVGDPSCASGRTIELRWRPAGASVFATVDQGTTAADGSFAFDHAPPNTGRFRAVLPAAGSCADATSADVPVRVRALVEASVASGSAEAGSCLEVFVVVSPPKPGQEVDLQRRSGGAWSSIATLPLNGESQARGDACLGWEDVGVARLRARWVAQDDLNETAPSTALVVEVGGAAWMRRIDDVIAGRAVSVAVAEEDVALYRRADGTFRAPASNEKLLLAMVSLDTFGPDHRIPTIAAAKAFTAGVVQGDLWLLGRGDPLVGPASLRTLAEELVSSGLTRVAGSVMGSTAYFRRDWDAPGWNDVARDYVNRPTALTFDGNADPQPERDAARSLTKQLEELGVRVAGAAGAGAPPAGVDPIASIDSKPLRVLLAKMLRPSWNFGAEVLGKGLGAEVRGTPGTIAKGAATIEAWVGSRGVGFTLFDNSGLSYDNRVTAAGLVELLGQAEDADWGKELRHALPTGGQGTLEDRLHGVPMRAKTGTLTDVSALSGWVFAEQRDAWIEFSILSAGMPKSVASEIEDRIVRILHHRAG